VVIDLYQPLERGRTLLLSGQSYWVSFRYEKLPDFCYRCGRVLHKPKGCPYRASRKDRHTESQLAWGSWLRAEDYSCSSGLRAEDYSCSSGLSANHRGRSRSSTQVEFESGPVAGDNLEGWDSEKERSACKRSKEDFGDSQPKLANNGSNSIDENIPLKEWAKKGGNSRFSGKENRSDLNGDVGKGRKYGADMVSTHTKNSKGGLDGSKAHITNKSKGKSTRLSSGSQPDSFGKNLRWGGGGSEKAHGPAFNGSPRPSI
jgi:hypothetical protein